MFTLSVCNVQLRNIGSIVYPTNPTVCRATALPAHYVPAPLIYVPVNEYLRHWTVLLFCDMTLCALQIKDKDKNTIKEKFMVGMTLFICHSETMSFVCISTAIFVMFLVVVNRIFS